MSKFLLHGTGRLAFCILAFGLWQYPCLAQSTGETPKEKAVAADEQIPPAVARELDAMRKRIEQLEAELKDRQTQEPPTAVASANVPATAGHALVVPAASEAAAAHTTNAPVETKPAKAEPFAFADFTWLNGTSRERDVPLDTKFFTPEIRADISYI
jgi:hypothetical protein